MNSLQSSLYTGALALCLFSTGLLSGKKSRTGTPFVYFIIFLVLESLGFVLELLMAHPATPLKSLWLGLRMGTSLLVAPCLWLAVREIAEGVRPQLSSLGQRQLWLIGIGFLLTAPLIETAHLGTDYYNPGHVTTHLHSQFIHGTMLLCIAIFAWQVPFYLWRCRRTLMQQLVRQNSENVSADLKAKTWLHLPLVIVFTTWLLGLLRTVQCASHAPQEFVLLFAFTDVSVSVGAIYMIVKRASSAETRPPAPVQTVAAPVAMIVLESPVAQLVEPPVQEKTEVVTNPPAIDRTPPTIPEVGAESKYAKSSLPSSVRERIKRKLRTALATEALYRDSLINLRSLSGSIKENAHYVSQVINQELNSSFYQLVNEYRIEEAKKLLTDFPEQTVLEIALAVGFNSKSTFHTAFRRNTGQTPSEYRASSSPKSE